MVGSILFVLFLQFLSYFVFYRSVSIGTLLVISRSTIEMEAEAIQMTTHLFRRGEG
jgi:hypothetical protein